MVAFIPMSQEGMHLMLEHQNDGVPLFIDLGFGLMVPANQIHKGSFCSLDSMLGNPQIHHCLENTEVAPTTRGNKWLFFLNVGEPLEHQKNFRQLFNLLPNFVPDTDKGPPESSNLWDSDHNAVDNRE